MEKLTSLTTHCDRKRATTDTNISSDLIVCPYNTPFTIYAKEKLPFEDNEMIYVNKLLVQ